MDAQPGTFGLASEMLQHQVLHADLLAVVAVIPVSGPDAARQRPTDHAHLRGLLADRPRPGRPFPAARRLAQAQNASLQCEPVAVSDEGVGESCFGDLQGSVCVLAVL